MFSYFASRDSHLHSISPSYLKFAVRGSRFAVRGSRFAARTLPQSLCLIHNKFAVCGSRFAPRTFPCLNISLKSSRFAPRTFPNHHFHSHKKFAVRASHLPVVSIANTLSSRLALRTLQILLQSTEKVRASRLAYYFSSFNKQKEFALRTSQF